MADTPVPRGCVNEDIGRRYWSLVRDPKSVVSCTERVTLMSHAAIECAACLRAVLVLQASRPSSGSENATETSSTTAAVEEACVVSGE